jgi:hypothetical protein
MSRVSGTAKESAYHESCGMALDWSGWRLVWAWWWAGVEGIPGFRARIVSWTGLCIVGAMVCIGRFVCAVVYNIRLHFFL